MTHRTQHQQPQHLAGGGNPDADGQRAWWNECYAGEPSLFGAEASRAGVAAAALFRKAGAGRILELGAGHGRDTLHLARNGLHVTALDYADEALRSLEAAAAAEGRAGSITMLRHDVRTPLPFADGSFDGAFAHMLLCMALDDGELVTLVNEARRVLRPGGLFVYTARTDRDPHYGRGIHHGGDLWETGGFIVHFFSRVTVEQIAQGWEAISVREFEEGPLPRRLVCVIMRRPEEV